MTGLPKSLGKKTKRGLHKKAPKPGLRAPVWGHMLYKA